MAEEGKAKYAAEIWELVRLFSRLGKTVYGLLLLVIGWALLVKAGRETLASKDAVEGLWLPWVKAGWPPILKWYHPSVSSVVIAGAAALSVWWLLYSRLLGYIWALTRHFLKPGVFVLAFVILFLFGLFNLALLPLTVPLMHAIRLSRRRSFKVNWLDRRGKEVPGETAAQRIQAWSSHLDAMEKAHGKEFVDTVLTKGAWEPSYFIVAEAVAGLVGKLLRGTLSRCRVGLAPVTAQSYVEEFNAAKLPLQVFAQAITRIRTDLSELALLDRIQFFELPPSARMQQWSQAVRFAWLFDTDVLLWGTYTEKAERAISMNLFSRRSQRNKTMEPDKYGSDYQQRFFPWSISIDFPALSFDQDDAYEVYLVLLVAEILALQAVQKRWEKGWRRLIRGFRVLDRMSLYSGETIQEILLRVVPQAMGRLGTGPLPESTPITGRRALVDLAGQWIGSMLNVRFGSAFEKLSQRKGKSSTVNLLRELAEACVRLKPEDPVAHYRLGALWILTNVKEEALQCFRKAGELERQSFQVHEIGARVAAELSGLSLTRYEEIALAVWAAHAACAINTGSEYAIKEVRDMVDKELPEKLIYAVLAKPEPTAVTVIKSMLPPKDEDDEKTKSSPIDKGQA